jgi:putative nucleotidyltransferase with HDIG domain
MIPRVDLPEEALSRLTDGGQDRIAVLRGIGGYVRAEGGRAYVVGGFIRDLLRMSISDDLDIAVSGVDPGSVARHLHTVARFSRPVEFPRFRTFLTVGKGVRVEICRLEGRIEQDCLRRDFTINCIYARLRRGRLPFTSVLDPTGRSVADLQACRLRTPADPCRSIWNDPLRMLRAVRFEATLGMTVDRDLADCIRRMAYLLTRSAPERQRLELERILLSRRLIGGFRELERLGLLAIVMPELDLTCGFSQATPYHAYDLFTHSLKTAAGLPPDLTLRLAGLLHDIGKAETQVVRGKRAVYYGHEHVSARKAEDLLLRLRFPVRLVREVRSLVENHMINYSDQWTDRAVRRFIRKTGAGRDRLLILAEADAVAQRPIAGRKVGARRLRERIRVLEKRGPVLAAPPLTGNDIMEFLGISSGPMVGRAKAFLEDTGMRRGRPLARDEARRALRRWAATLKDRGVIDVDKLGRG